MCEIGNSLKLCTCKGRRLSSRDFWCLYRYREGQELITIGDPVLPIKLDPAITADHDSFLLNQLNSKNCFDFDPKLQDKDRLSLHYKCGDKFIVYGYEYQDGKWVSVDFDYFGWLSDHVENCEGKIQKD